LDSHGQLFSNKDLEEMAKELSQQAEEEEKEKDENKQYTEHPLRHGDPH
jgi:hypothetical protein